MSPGPADRPVRRSQHGPTPFEMRGDEFLETANAIAQRLIGILYSNAPTPVPDTGGR